MQCVVHTGTASAKTIPQNLLGRAAKIPTHNSNQYPLNHRLFLLQRVAHRAIPGKFRGVAPVACDGFGNGYWHIAAGLQPVNEGMPEHVGPEVQVPHGHVQRGGARGVANL